eukprot:9478442-Pyramimonas_sp.AAC.1
MTRSPPDFFARSWPTTIKSCQGQLPPCSQARYKHKSSSKPQSGSRSTSVGRSWSAPRPARGRMRRKALRS